MDIQELNSGIVGGVVKKPWLNIVANSFTGVTGTFHLVVADQADITDVVIDDLSANLLTLNNQTGVPNAPLLATTFWSSGSGNLSQTDPLGSTVTYTTSGMMTNAVMSNGSPSVLHDIPYYDDTTGLLVSDSGINSSNIFLANGSVAMTGDINLSAHSLDNVENINTVPVGEYVLNTSLTGVSGNLPKFSVSSPAIIQDSGIPASSVFLANGSVPMTGNLNMNNHNITDISQETYNNNINIMCGNNQNLIIGNSSLTIGGGTVNSIIISSGGGSINNANQICIGTNNNAGSGAQYIVAVGDGINATNFGSVNLGGGNSGIVNPQQNSLAMGNDLVLGAGNNGICMGNSASIGAVNDAIAMGTSAVNNVASSFLFGDPSVTNIRANNDSFCDLGTSTARYNNLYSCALRVKQGSNALSGTGAVLVGGTVTVATTAVNTGDSIFLSRTALGGTQGFEYISAISDGVSFDISSSSALDTSTFNWIIIKPA